MLCLLFVVMLTEVLESFVAGLPFGAEVYLPMEFTDTAGQTLQGGTHTGTISGGVSFTPGKVGQAMYTDGITGEVYMGDRRDSCFFFPDLCNVGYTMAFWIKKPFTDMTVDYIGNGATASLSYGISVRATTSNNLRVSLKTTTTWWKAEFTIQDDMWQHIAFSWPKNGDLIAYLDGQPIMTATEEANSMPTSDFNDFVFGRVSTQVSQFGEVHLDEILFWPEDKSAAFINNLYHYYQGTAEQPSSINTKYVTSSMGPSAAIQPILEFKPANIYPGTQSCSPCVAKCMWEELCGLSVWDGVSCKLYNVFYDIDDFEEVGSGVTVFWKK